MTPHAEQFRSLLLLIVTSCADDPEAISVDLEDSEESLVLKLRVSPGDLGRIIGKQGKMAQSMRIVLAALGRKLSIPCSLDIVDDQKQ